MIPTHRNADSTAVHDIGHWIAGRVIPVADIKTSPVFNPATGICADPWLQTLRQAQAKV
jgi:hypothetical protein